MYVQLFKIHKCGFYKPHEEQRRFGAPREWYKDFLNWINIVSRDRADYSRTTTFPERDTVPTSIFCTGAVEDGRGNFGVALFNEGYRTDGGVEYIPRTGRMGSVPINVTSAPEDSRTGWTSYFWVMPDEELVVALMPEKKITSIASFRDYFKKYLERRSEYLYPICDSMTGEVLYYLYKGYLDAQPTPDASPIFETFQPVIYQNVQEIYNNWQNINRFFLHCEEEFLRMEPTTPLTNYLKTFTISYHRQ